MRLTAPLTALLLCLATGPAARAGVPAAPHSAQSAAERGYLGIQMTVEDGAMVVQGVQPDSPAEVAGLAVGDRITSIAGHEVGDGAALTEHLTALRAGQTVTVRVERDGWQRELEVELASRSAVGLEPMTEAEGPPAGTDEAAQDDSIELFRQRWNERKDGSEESRPHLRLEVQRGDDERVYEAESFADLGEKIRAQVERELGRHGMQRDGGFAMRMPRFERGDFEALREEIRELRQQVAELSELREELSRLRELRQEVHELVRALREE